MDGQRLESERVLNFLTRSSVFGQMIKSALQSYRPGCLELAAYAGKCKTLNTHILAGIAAAIYASGMPAFSNLVHENA